MQGANITCTCDNNRLRNGLGIIRTVSHGEYGLEYKISKPSSIPTLTVTAVYADFENLLEYH